MSTSALVFMISVWAIVIATAAYFFRRILRVDRSRRTDASTGTPGSRRRNANVSAPSRKSAR